LFELGISDYCRDVEAYLCRKNDGHLIRVTGPSFVLVSGWAERGVPLKVAFQGIDRYFERYYRKGPRRRPVKIDFCEADVLDVFDEWRRATGVAATAQTTAAAIAEPPAVAPPSRRSLHQHLERVVLRLSSARATGVLDASADDLIDRVARELDAARASARGLRGDARRQLIDRLAVLDREIIAIVRRSLDAGRLHDFAREADADLAPFRRTMSDEAFTRARDAAVDRLVRETHRLPTIAFE
jgi:hypothetical protein